LLDLVFEGIKKVLVSLHPILLLYANGTGNLAGALIFKEIAFRGK
jgi:hypothetical protein